MSGSISSKTLYIWISANIFTDLTHIPEMCVENGDAVRNRALGFVAQLRTLCSNNVFTESSPDMHNFTNLSLNSDQLLHSLLRGDNSQVFGPREGSSLRVCRLSKSSAPWRASSRAASRQTLETKRHFPRLRSGFVSSLRVLLGGPYLFPTPASYFVVCPKARSYLQL